MKNLATLPEHKLIRDKLSISLDNWMKQTNDDGDPRSHPRRTAR